MQLGGHGSGVHMKGIRGDVGDRNDQSTLYACIESKFNKKIYFKRKMRIFIKYSYVLKYCVVSLLVFYFYGMLFILKLQFGLLQAGF